MDPLSNKFIRYNALNNLMFGEKEIRELKKIVKKDKCSIDVGANLGVYTYFLSKLSTHVYSYEPHPKLASMLENCTLYNNVTIHNIALSDTVGEDILTVPLNINAEENTQSGGLKAGNVREKAIKYVIKKNTLDNYYYKSVGFIKIDVEGHEECVILGGLDLILRDKPNLLIEIEQRHISKDIYDIFNFITSLGYNGYYLNENKYETISKFHLEKHQNYERYLNEIRDGILPHKYINNFIFLNP